MLVKMVFYISRFTVGIVHVFLQCTVIFKARPNCCAMVATVDTITDLRCGMIMDDSCTLWQFIVEL